MKMTDAEMDAMVEQIIDRAGRESSTDGMDGDRWDRILVRAALTARLAADHQKGGGDRVRQAAEQLDAARWRKLEELVDTDNDRYWYVHPSDGEGGAYDRMKSANHLRQCIDRELAHPPHADQETQG